MPWLLQSRQLELPLRRHQMRRICNVLLAVAAVVLAAGLAAPWAGAQSVEVVAEDGGHCGDVVEEAAHDISGGCEVTIVSVFGVSTFNHSGLSEVQTTACENEMTANFDEHGTGYIDTTETTVHEFEPGCAIDACEESATGTNPHAELEWPIAGIFEYGGEQEEMIFTFCIRPHTLPEGAFATCTVAVEVGQDHDAHVLNFTASEEPCHENPANELSGTWRTVGTEEIELIHEHYPGS